MNPAVPPRRRQPLLMGIILIFLVLTVWAVDQARRKVSSVVDRDYYTHGLKFNQTDLEQRAARTQGWTLRMHLAGPTLDIFLCDATGNPVTGAEGHLTILGSAAAAVPPSGLPVREEGPGHYLASIPGGLAGQVPALVTLARDGASIHRSLLLNF